MINEQVIITKIGIKKQGERKHFQINLPRNSKFIIGVAYGERLISVVDGYYADNQIAVFKKNQLLGELRLQSCEEANCFYSADIIAKDSNLNYQDYSNEGFLVQPYTHQNKRTIEQVKVNAESTIVQGLFTDIIGKSLNTNVWYEVSIYVWINVEE